MNGAAADGNEAARLAPLVTLPWPPGVNRWLRVYHGRAILSREARAFKDAAALACLHAGLRPLAGPVAVRLDLYRPRRIGDADGPSKLALDALQGWAYEDDKQVCELHVYRHDDRERPRVEVRVWPHGTETEAREETT